MSEPTFHETKPDGPLAELGRFEHLADARERGLVVAAMELPHWIVRQGGGYVLYVEEKDGALAMAALLEFEREERSRPVPAPLEPLRIPVFAVMMTLLAMLLLFLVQQRVPQALVERGVADNFAIRAGEWWRVLTALTLHGDIEHIISNLSLGIFVFAFALWRFGTGIGLLATVLGGALGNVLNALLHLAHHRSIGSSTALFAALGLLCGAEVAARLGHRGTRAGVPFIVPVGAGMAFLALYGGGGGQNRDGTPITDIGNVDLGAHLYGLVAGMLVGAALFSAGWKNDASRARQIAAGVAAVALLAGAWALAA